MGEKVTEELPCGIATLAGTVMAAPLLVTPMLRLPAEFESVAVQLLLLPTGIRFGVQVKDTKVGVAHSVRVTLCDELPSVAVMDADEFETTLPTVALKVTDEVPGGITTVAGTVIKVELELSDTEAFDPVGCARVTVHKPTA